MGFQSFWHRGTARLRQPLRHGVDLLGLEQTSFPPPRLLGLNLGPATPAWSLQRVSSILDQLQDQATAELILEARYGRHCLSRFWLEAPVDQLARLWEGELGQLQRQFIASPLRKQELSRDERRWRHRLLDGLGTNNASMADRWNHLLAVHPYLEGSQFPETIEADALPSWLKELSSWCGSARQAPRGLLSPGLSEEPDAPHGFVLPRLVPTEGGDLLQELSQPSCQKRGLGLIRLLQIDPSDQEVLDELRVLRLMLAQLLLDVSPDSLEALYRSPIGDLYRQLVQSELSRAELSSTDQEHRDRLMDLLVNQETGRDATLLLAVALFHPFERIEINLSSFELPMWMPGVWRELSDGIPPR